MVYCYISVYFFDLDAILSKITEDELYMKIEVDKSTIKGEKEKVQAIKFKPSLDR